MHNFLSYLEQICKHCISFCVAEDDDDGDDDDDDDDDDDYIYECCWC